MQPAAAEQNGEGDDDADDDLDDAAFVADGGDLDGAALAPGASGFVVRRHGEAVARRWSQVVDAELE